MLEWWFVKPFSFGINYLDLWFYLLQLFFGLLFLFIACLLFDGMCVYVVHFLIYISNIWIIVMIQYHCSSIPLLLQGLYLEISPKISFIPVLHINIYPYHWECFLWSLPLLRVTRSMKSETVTRSMKSETVTRSMKSETVTRLMKNKICTV